MAERTALEEAIRTRLRDLRTSRGLTQERLSGLMVDAGYRNLSKNRISEIEIGERKVRLDEAVGFAKVLGVDLDDLVGPPEEAAYAEWYASWWRRQAEVWLANAAMGLGPLVDAHRIHDQETIDRILEEIGRQVDVWRSAMLEEDAREQLRLDAPSDQDWDEAYRANDPDGMARLRERNDRAVAAYRAVLTRR